MLYIAVVDIKESFSAVAVYAEGWKSRELLGAQIVRGRFLDRAEGTAWKVKEAIERLSPEEPEIILLLPRSIVHVTRAEVPAKNETILKKMMEFEITRHFPIPREELVYDYMALENPAAGRDRYSLNLAGLRRADFDAYLKAAADAGIRPAEISYSSVAWLPPESEDGEAGKRCFIEIMPEGFEMSIVEGSRLVYSRFSRYRPRVEEKYFYEEKAGGESPAFRIADQISEELNHIRLVAGAEPVGEYLKKVFIAGGSVLRRPVGRRLAQKPSFSESEVWYLPDDDGTGFDYAAKVTGAQGLDQAGIRFNVMPPGGRPARREDAGRRLKLSLYAAVVLAFVWLASGYGIEWKTASDLEKRLANLKSRASAMEEGGMSVEEYQKYFDSFSRFTGAPSLTIDVIDILTRALPKGTFLTEIDMRGGDIRISGISSDASELLKILEATPRFKSVRMAGAVKAAGGREKFRVGMEFE